MSSTLYLAYANSRQFIVNGNDAGNYHVRTMLTELAEAAKSQSVTLHLTFANTEGQRISLALHSPDPP